MNVKFPLEVWNGSCVVKIYEPKDRSKGYIISYYTKGKRIREGRNDFAQAKRHAQLVAAKIAQGELEVLKLRDQDRFVYLRALETLQPTGSALDLAVAEYAQAVKFLKGGSLAEAVQFYVANNS